MPRQPDEQMAGFRELFGVVEGPLCRRIRSSEPSFAALTAIREFSPQPVLSDTPYVERPSEQGFCHTRFAEWERCGHMSGLWIAAQ